MSYVMSYVARWFCVIGVQSSLFQH